MRHNTSFFISSLSSILLGALLVATPMGALAQSGASSGTPATNSVTSQAATLPAGNANCSEYYRLGSVLVDLSPRLAGTIPGATMTFSGMVKNTNPYPLVGLDVYVKIFHKQTNALSVEQNGHLLVDQFVAIKDLTIPANSEKPVTVDWVVPTRAATGDYMLATYAIVDQRYNLSGLSFTDNVTGATAAFSIKGLNVGSVTFNKNKVLMNKRPFSFASSLPQFSADEVVTIEVPIVNTTSKSLTALVSWKQYSWDGQQESEIVEKGLDEVSLKPAETKILSFTAKKHEGAVTYVVADANVHGAHSIVDVRFARDGVKQARINFPSLNLFPLKDGQETAIFSCLHAVGTETLKDGKLELVLTDDRGKKITSEIYEGDITGNMMGVAKKFTPSKNYDKVTLTATLSRGGVVEEVGSMVYDCNAIDPTTCANDAWGMFSDNALGTMVLIIVLLVLLISGAYYHRRKSATPVAVFFLAVLFGAMGVSPMVAEAAPPVEPIIVGPGGQIDQALTFSFTGSDPDLDMVSVEIDWDNNFTADQLTATVPSGTMQSASFTWTSAGVQTFNARTFALGEYSAWTAHVVTVTLPPPVTFFITSIVCDMESKLPDIANDVQPVTSTTATDFVAANPGCTLAPGWQFQWAYDVIPRPVSGLLIGEAPNTGPLDSEWKTSLPTNAGGLTQITVNPKSGAEMIWLREVMQPGYGLFSDNIILTTTTDVSPEFLCDMDSNFYDNHEHFTPNANPSYWCVAYNYTVSPPPAPALSASPNPINSGQTSVLTVTAAGASNYTIYDAVGTPIISGLLVAGVATWTTPPLAVTTTYQASVNNGGLPSGLTSAIVNVNTPAGITGNQTYTQVATGPTGNIVNTDIGATEAGVTFTWAGLPPGATVTAGPNATISNLPYSTSPTVYNLTVTLTDSGGAVSGPYAVTITLTAPADPVITTAIVTPNGTDNSTIPSGTTFTLLMTSTGATDGRWSRTDNGVPDWTNQPIPVANGGPTQFNLANTFTWAGAPIDHTFVWTFVATNAVLVDSAPRSVSLTILASVPSVSISPLGMNFGSIPIGSQSTRSFLVRNNGGSGSLLSGAVTSADPRFTCVPLAACSYSNVVANADGGAGVNVTLTYTPTLPFGIQTTVLTFTNTFPGASVSTAVGVVFGTSISPITFNSAIPTTFPNPPVLDFGEVVISRTRDLAFIMTNISQTVIPAFNLVFPVGSPFGCFAAGVAVIPCTVPPIPASNGTHTVTIRFTPPPPTQLTFTNTVELNELAGPTIRTEFFTAIGTAVPPVFKVIEQ